MKLHKGKKSSKSRLVPAMAVATSEDNANIDGIDGDVTVTGPETAPSLPTPQPRRSSCGTCKVPNYGLNIFAPRLEVNFLDRICGY